MALRHALPGRFRPRCWRGRSISGSRGSRGPRGGGAQELFRQQGAPKLASEPRLGACDGGLRQRSPSSFLTASAQHATARHTRSPHHAQVRLWGGGGGGGAARDLHARLRPRPRAAAWAPGPAAGCRRAIWWRAGAGDGTAAPPPQSLQRARAAAMNCGDFATIVRTAPAGARARHGAGPCRRHRGTLGRGAPPPAGPDLGYPRAPSRAHRDRTPLKGTNPGPAA